MASGSLAGTGTGTTAARAGSQIESIGHSVLADRLGVLPGSDRVQDALSYLLAHIDAGAWSEGSERRQGREPGAAVDRTRRLLDLLGNPERSLGIVHITGTNGKTSTAWLVSAMLRSAGLRVGTFTSPHLQQVTERIAFNGEPVSEGELAQALLEVRAVAPGTSDGNPRFFEILSAAAIWHFARRGADVAVVEVGIGGREDATNALDADVAVATNVGLDHVELLGPTTVHIAGQKAGIIKQGSIAIVGEVDKAVDGVFASAAEAVEARALLRWGRDFGASALAGSSLGHELAMFTPAARYEGLWSPLRGRHQDVNAGCALAAAEAFLGHPLGREGLQRALREAELPGRLEVVGSDPVVLLDGVKNASGAYAAARALDEDFGSARGRVLVVGLLRGHDPEEILLGLAADRARAVVVCTPPTSRAMPVDQILAAVERIGGHGIDGGDVREAMEMGISLAGPEDIVLVTGSLYVVGAAREALAAEHVEPAAGAGIDPLAVENGR